MRRNAVSVTASADIVKHIDGLTEANFNLLTRLITRLDENEKRHRKFVDCVLIRLAKIETMLTDIQGCQLAEFWPAYKVPEEKRARYLKEVRERMDFASEEMGLKMLRFIHEKEPSREYRYDRRGKWWGWEI